MVVRLTKGRRVAGAIRYNERKVQSGQAVQLDAANFGHLRLALTSVGYKTKTLEHLTQRNPRISQPCIHCALAFHPDEQLSDDQLRRISTEFMNSIGYGTQPYLLYRHHDTAHPHVHVVTVAVNSDGRRISDAFLHSRISRIRRQLEQRHGLRPAQERLTQNAESVGIKAGTSDAQFLPMQLVGTVSGGEPDILWVLRLVEQAYPELQSEPEKIGRNAVAVCVDDLVLRHGVPPLDARRAVEMFLSNRKVRNHSPFVEEKVTHQKSTNPQRIPLIRRRPSN